MQPSRQLKPASSATLAIVKHAQTLLKELEELRTRRLSVLQKTRKYQLIRPAAKRRVKMVCVNLLLTHSRHLLAGSKMLLTKIKTTMTLVKSSKTRRMPAEVYDSFCLRSL